MEILKDMEFKDASGGDHDADIKSAIQKLGTSFEEFKSSNDENLKKRDVVLEEKLQKLNTSISEAEKAKAEAEAAKASADELKSRLDEFEKKAARPGRGADGEPKPDPEYKAAFCSWARKGKETEIDGLIDERKSANIGTPEDGGYAVPEDLDREIEKLVRDNSPIRSLAYVVKVGSANYKKLVNTGGANHGWVGETAPRPETDTSKFEEITPPLGEIYANPAATQAMLDDAFFDVEQWLADEIGLEFSEAEQAAFVNGTGVNKPKGFLTYATSSDKDATRPFGTLQHLSTGVSGGFPAQDPSDILIDLVHSLRAGYRQGASFLMNGTTLADIRKFKDADGNYIWRPGLTEGVAGKLLGYSALEAEDMPDIAAGSLSIAFGNWKRGYMITDRMGTRTLRDPYSNKPFVHFYSTRRVGGAVINSEAIKLLKFAL